jgi:hypothetical protein
MATLLLSSAFENQKRVNHVLLSLEVKGAPRNEKNARARVGGPKTGQARCKKNVSGNPDTVL